MGSNPIRPAVFLLIPAFFLGGAAHAAGLSLPEGVRPGAQRPQETGPKIPKQPPGKLFQVPPVVQRPLKKEQGPKVRVTSFDLKGAQDRPRFGIKVAAIQEILAKQKAKKPGGFTVGELQDVANAVTKYYREHGLILAQAYVPAQTVKKGVVQIDVLEGTLGRVLVQGNKSYSPKLLERPFEDLIGKPVTKNATESALLTLTDYPGLSLFGVFQPGQEVGTTDMVLKVQKEKKFEGRLRWDNHGIRETGERRVRMDLAWNNPTGAADQLKVTLQQTFLERNSHFYGFEYDRPIFRPGYAVQIGYNENPFAVGGQFKGRDIAADTRIGFLDFSRQFIRSRELNVKATIGLDKKWAETTVQSRPVSVDNLTVLKAK
ncbi:MAG TPA: POTRA domain-containing protein, partial [Pseudodesulfovibrio sp.]|nr:POTRA domain-containing protein [Pseudodesulfovibrio sp.]